MMKKLIANAMSGLMVLGCVMSAAPKSLALDPNYISNPAIKEAVNIDYNWYTVWNDGQWQMEAVFSPPGATEVYEHQAVETLPEGISEKLDEMFQGDMPTEKNLINIALVGEQGVLDIEFGGITYEVGDIVGVGIPAAVYEDEAPTSEDTQNIDIVLNNPLTSLHFSSGQSIGDITLDYSANLSAMEKIELVEEGVSVNAITVAEGKQITADTIVIAGSVGEINIEGTLTSKVLFEAGAVYGSILAPTGTPALFNAFGQATVTFDYSASKTDIVISGNTSEDKVTLNGRFGLGKTDSLTIEKNATLDVSALQAYLPENEAPSEETRFHVSGRLYVYGKLIAPADTIIGTTGNAGRIFVAPWANVDAAFTYDKKPEMITFPKNKMLSWQDVEGGQTWLEDETTPETIVNGNDVAVSAVAVTNVNSMGEVYAEISEEAAQAAIDAAKAASASNVVVTFVTSLLSSGTAVSHQELVIPANVIAEMASESNFSINIKTELGDVALDHKALTTVADKLGTGVNALFTLVVEAKSTAGLPSAAQALIGGRTVVELEITDEKGKEIKDFDDGKAKVKLPYTLGVNENPNAVVVYYVDGSGATIPTVGHYSNGSISFETSHFSTYAIGYNVVSFKDVATSSNAKAAVDFIAARGITVGVGDNSFGASQTLKRGDYVIWLMRSFGITQDFVDSYNCTVATFTDVGEYRKDWYHVARDLGITSGTGNNKLSANLNITRAEMYQMTYNAIKSLSALPATQSGVTASSYSDYSQFATYFRTAIDSLVATGLVSESSTLRPKDAAVRSEIAVILYSILSNR